MRVLVASPDKDEIQKAVIPVLERIGASVLGYCISADSLADKVKTLQPDLLLLRMDLARRGEEEAFLAALGVPVAVILPRGRANLHDALLALPNVRCVAVLPDVDYVQLSAGLVQPAGAPVKPVAQPVVDPVRVLSVPPTLASARPPVARKRATCLVFLGVKGGVGTTTALCALAVAASGAMRVGVVDLTMTGEARMTLPESSSVKRLDLDRAEVGAQWARLRSEFDLILVDAGRLPALPVQLVGAITVGVTRADTTDRLPNDISWVVVSQSDRAPVGLKAVATLPTQPDLYAQIAEGRFLQPGPLLDAASAWANAIQHGEVQR